MTRSLALMVSFLLASTTAAPAQTHPQHPQGRPHGQAGHTPLDPSQHAAMHALLHGSWAGTSSSPGGVTTKLSLAVGTDTQGKLALKMTTDQPVRVGAASHVAIEGHALHWTQNVSGAPCKASATVSPASLNAPETMKGSMACEQGEISFALHKTKG